MTPKICPMVAVMELLSKRWTLLVLHNLSSGEKKRFSEISNSLEHINPRILSLRLKDLEKAGILIRERYNEIPPRVDYSLTSKGKDLLACFKYLDQWVMKWK